MIAQFCEHITNQWILHFKQVFYGIWIISQQSYYKKKKVQLIILGTYFIKAYVISIAGRVSTSAYSSEEASFYQGNHTTNSNPPPWPLSLLL